MQVNAVQEDAIPGDHPNRFLTIRLTAKNGVKRVKSVIVWVKSPSDLTQSVSDLTQTTLDFPVHH
jgi:hypothetical protein